MAKSLTDLKIGDLVEVPVVKTVIDMSEVRDLDPDDPEGRVTLENLSHSFIITEDIEKILAVILDSFRQPTGQGFFIIGTYGSGKSHLLSVLGLLARYSWAKASVFSNNEHLPELANALEAQRLLPVMIPLTEYPSDTPLEKIIWHETEQTAAVAGIPLSLSYSVRYLELFNKYILPVHTQEFYEFLRKRFEDITWEQICRDDLASAHTIIVQFIHRKGLSIPFEIATDRKSLMDSLISSLNESGWDGVFFIIDELSEFLKSKPSTQQLNEDTRFLQFLGEISANTPIWIVAALQETIERTGEIAPEVFKKIKDRYHQRLRLTTKHLHELVSKRLIRRKSKDAVRIIETLFENLKRAFNRIPITCETFTSIYPVHPETLELLNQNIDLFSQRRGIVDFLTARIGGRVGSQIKGILHEHCSSLLTPDVIFDHFIDRLSESPRFSPFYLLYQQQMVSRIENIFTDPAEQEAALRTVKTLIVLAVSPLNETRSARELANMILYRVMDESISAGEANYAFFEERILNKLHENIGAIRKTNGDTPLDNRYKIEIIEGANESIEDRISRIKPGLSCEWKQVIENTMKTMSHGQFPLAVFFDRTSYRDSILWQNSRRRIAIRLHDFLDLTSSDIDLMREECTQGKVDQVLLIAKPGDPATLQVQAQRFLALENESTMHFWFFCIPKLVESDDLRNAVLEVQSCSVLMADGNQNEEETDDRMYSEIRDRRERFSEQIREHITHSIRNGSYFTSEGHVTFAGHKRYPSFDQWLETVIDTPLKRRFPDHGGIVTEVDCTSRVIQDLLMEQFIKPGKTTNLSSGRDAALVSALEHIAIPLGLARKKAKQYVLSCNPRSSIPVATILEQLPITKSFRNSIKDRSVPAGRIWLNVHNSTLGMSRPVFDLTLACMIRKGYLNAYFEDVVLDVRDLKLPLTGQIKRLGRGQLITEELRPAFALLHKTLTGKHLGELDIDIQIQLWKKLFDQMSIWKEIVAQFRENHSVIQSRFPQFTGNISAIEAQLAHLDSLEDFLEQLDINSVEWDTLFPVISQIDEFSSIPALIRKLKAFNQSVFTAYLVAIAFLNDSRMNLPDLPDFDSLRSLHDLALSNSVLVDSLILESTAKTFFENFEAFRLAYSDAYSKAHSLRNSAIEKFDFNSVFNSPEARLLSRLQEIPIIRRSIKHGKAVNKMLALKQSICQLDPRAFLVNSPVCTCGYILGDSLEIASAEEILANMKLQIKLALEIIQSSEITRKVTSNPETSVSAAEKIQYLGQLESTGAHLVDEIEQQLDNDVIAALKEVHLMKKPEVTIQLTSLIDILEGQTMTFDQAKSRINSWINSIKDVADDDWLNFK